MRRSELRHFLVLLVFVAMPALAGWKQDYARGLEAAKDGRWEDVQRHMEAALADNATPATRVRLYGQRFEAYAPQHYAGLAALRLGDCDKALALWSQAANKTVTSANSELANQENQGRIECSSRLVRQGKATPSETPVAANQTPRPSAQPVPERAPPPSRAVVKAAPLSRAVESSSSSVSRQILRPLVDAYLNGRYSDVIKLSNQVPPTPGLRWQMLTLRAAAAYNLSQLEPSDTTTEIARKAADQARSTDQARKPDIRYFSPKFIRFFNGS